MKWILVVCLVSFLNPVRVTGTSLAARPRGVSNEDIKDAIISLVHMFRDLTEKLERHEYRERQLGEQLKKALSSLDKRERAQDTRIDNVLTAVQSLERRVAASQDTTLKEKEMYTFDPTPLNSWMSNLEGRLVEDQSKEIGKIMAVMDGTLASRFEHLEREVGRLSSVVVNLEAETMGKISNLEASFINRTEHFTNDVTDRIANVGKNLDWISNREQNAISDKTDDTLEQVSNKMDILLRETGAGLQHFKKEFNTLTKVEHLLLQTADNVMDTKRRVEYGVHQILLEVGELIRGQGQELNSTVNTRFSDISARILDNQNAGLVNLTSKVETEISQVWRQIGIMYKQLSASAGALDSLQKQTEQYVNGSLSTMDGMENKVGLITSRMNEVDENLNYLLGRLSLVTQEFNLTKTALAQALEKIRASFKEVKQNVDNVGPNPISEENKDVDNTLP